VSPLRRLGHGAVRLGASLRGTWRSVRPASRRGGLVGLLKLALLAALISVGVFVGTGLASSSYAEYGYHPATNALAWARLDPTFANASVCATCHGPEHAKLTSGGHAGIGCESCHGALLAHAIASQASPSAELAAIAVPTDTVCVTCHVRTVGRPAAIPQVMPSQHYAPMCLQCHDPHTGISRRPPVVSHPLGNLPPCLTCHGPEGFKARNQRHPTVPTDDATCLECHASGRGPAAPGN
jgi:hypothetical protein